MLQCSLSFKDVPNSFSFSCRLLMVLPEVWQNHLQTSRWFVEEVMDSIWDCAAWIQHVSADVSIAAQQCYQTWDGIHSAIPRRPMPWHIRGSIRSFATESFWMFSGTLALTSSGAQGTVQTITYILCLYQSLTWKFGNHHGTPGLVGVLGHGWPCLHYPFKLRCLFSGVHSPLVSNSQMRSKKQLKRYKHSQHFFSGMQRKFAMQTQKLHLLPPSFAFRRSTSQAPKDRAGEFPLAYVMSCGVWWNSTSVSQARFKQENWSWKRVCAKMLSFVARNGSNLLSLAEW